MDYSQPQPAHQVAAIALKNAMKECAAAGLNPCLFESQLTELVCSEVRDALAEMAEHYANGGPSAILMLAEPVYQNIYFADAGRRAAETLINNTEESSRRPSHLQGNR